MPLTICTFSAYPLNKGWLHIPLVLTEGQAEPWICLACPTAVFCLLAKAARLEEGQKANGSSTKRQALFLWKASTAWSVLLWVLSFSARPSVGVHQMQPCGPAVRIVTQMNVWSTSPASRLCLRSPADIAAD